MAVAKRHQLSALLIEAAAASDRGDANDAFSFMTRAWSLARLEPLTEAFFALSERAQVEPLPQQTDQQKRYLQWCARAKARRPLDVAVLLRDFAASVERHQERAHFIRGRVKVLREFAPDPRIGRFLLWLLQIDGIDLNHSAFLAAKRHIDPSAHELPGVFDDLLVEAQVRAAPTGIEVDDVAAELDGLMRSIERARFEVASALAEELPGHDSEEALLAAVYANPGDDALRQIYADALTERGDARGEFITLQFQHAAKTITAEGAKRELTLLNKHRASWLGPLGPFIVKSTASFDKGFVSAVDSNVRRIYLARQALELVEWATVKEIRFDKIAFFSKTMRALEIAVNVGPFGIDLLTALDTPFLPPLKGATLHPRAQQSSGDPLQWPWLNGLGRFSTLKSLVLEFAFRRAHDAAFDAQRITEACAVLLPKNVTDLSMRGLFNARMHDNRELSRLIAAVLTSAPPQVKRLEVEYFSFEKVDGAWQRARRR